MPIINRQTLMLWDDRLANVGIYSASVEVTINGRSERVPATIAEDGCVTAFGVSVAVSRGGKQINMPAAVYEWENLDGTITESAAYGQCVMPAEVAKLQFDGDQLLH